MMNEKGRQIKKNAEPAPANVRKEWPRDQEFILFCTSFEDGMNLHPGEERIPVCYRFRYFPPYTEAEKFRGIRDLQLQVRRKNVFARDCRIFMDITEWAGHEREDYFLIMLKFLHDKADTWRYTFIVREVEPRHSRSMFQVMRCYMRGALETDRRCVDRKFLQEYLEDTYLFDTEAAALMAAVLWDSEAEHIRSDAFIRSVISDIREKDDWLIRKEDLLQIMQDPCSALRMAVGEKKLHRHLETDGREEEAHVSLRL